MATKTIGALPAASSVNLADLAVISQSGTTKQATFTQIQTALGGGGGGFTEGAKITHASPPSIADITITTLTFDTETYDTDSMHEGVTNPSRLTFTTAGTYQVVYTGMFASNATGYRYAAIYQGGVALMGLDSKNAVNGTVTGLNLPLMLTVTAGQYIDVRVYQSSGGALSLIASALTAQRIG